MKLDLAVIGLVETRAMLKGLGERATIPAPAMKAAGVVIQRGLAEVWETQGEAIGRQWAPLSPNTIERKARQGQPAELLRATGALQAAMTGGAKIKVERSGVRVGVGVGYARMLMGGRDNMPSRRLLGVPPAALFEATLAIRQYIEGKRKKVRP